MEVRGDPADPISVRLNLQRLEHRNEHDNVSGSLISKSFEDFRWQCDVKVTPIQVSHQIS